MLICDGQEVVNPDLIPNATVPPHYFWVERWNWHPKNVAAQELICADIGSCH